MKEKSYCPECLKYSYIEKKCGMTTITIEKETFDVKEEYCICLSCNSEFVDVQTCIDPLELAYNKYREKHHLLFPQEIFEIRKSKGLSLEEMGVLAGIEPSVLERYEHGGLQSKEHNLNILRIK